MKKLKINTYTDESGQDTKGRMFVVCTVVISSDKIEEIEKKLIEIEKESNKNKKWYRSGNERRSKYAELLIKKHVLADIDIYFSEYQNKLEYTNLVGSHIAKAIFAFVDDSEYITKIFIDKMDKRTLSKITKEIKSFRIRFKKIRGLSEESNPYIRLADAFCGLIRDMNNKGIPKSYKILFSKMQKL